MIHASGYSSCVAGSVPACMYEMTYCSMLYPLLGLNRKHYSVIKTVKRSYLEDNRLPAVSRNIEKCVYHSLLHLSFLLCLSYPLPLYISIVLLLHFTSPSLSLILSFPLPLSISISLSTFLSTHLSFACSLNRFSKSSICFFNSLNYM